LKQKLADNIAKFGAESMLLAALQELGEMKALTERQRRQIEVLKVNDKTNAAAIEALNTLLGGEYDSVTNKWSNEGWGWVHSNIKNWLRLKILNAYQPPFLEDGHTPNPRHRNGVNKDDYNGEVLEKLPTPFPDGCFYDPPPNKDRKRKKPSTLSGRKNVE